MSEMWSNDKMSTDIVKTCELAEVLTTITNEIGFWSRCLDGRTEWPNEEALRWSEGLKETRTHRDLQCFNEFHKSRQNTNLFARCRPAPWYLKRRADRPMLWACCKKYKYECENKIISILNIPTSTDFEIVPTTSLYIITVFSVYPPYIHSNQSVATCGHFSIHQEKCTLVRRNGGYDLMESTTGIEHSWNMNTARRTGWQGARIFCACVHPNGLSACELFALHGSRAWVVEWVWRGG
jgi:hypothetical protein